MAQNLRYAMEYDALGRLTKRTEYNLRTNEVNNVETYSYDAAGNILEAETGAGKDTYVYGKDNQLVEWNGKDYGISAKGNTTRHMHEGEVVYVDYDGKDRIKKIGGDLNEYWYDADDNRINMYYYHTNMKYSYDSSGGRHRLLWTSSHLEEVSIYGSANHFQAAFQCLSRIFLFDPAVFVQLPLAICKWIGYNKN
ncbi:MAG: RHS repeat protein [Clostridiales bacterium]|nr:RHS repeat protein [Clostridiales bacterium]